jgi:hypothetical protein
MPGHVDTSNRRTRLEGVDVPNPGAYIPDETQGITRPEDLPKPKVIERSRNYKHRPCPKCGHSASRLRTVVRTLYDLGDLVSGRPRTLRVTYSQHRCGKCNTYFDVDMDDLALPKSRYTLRAMATAVRVVVEDGLPYSQASWHMWRDHRLFVPPATIQNWVEGAGKKIGSVRHGRVPR